MPETPSTRHTVFISYSHADRRYLDELLLHLEPLRREGNVRVWVDTMLKAGDDWREEIASALASARVAIMLVSAAFRASKFIAENELPPLLAAAKKEGLLILPVFVGACDFHASELAGVQAVNDPERPLAPMPKPRREMEWVKVARRVRDVFPARQRQKQMDAPINSAPELDSAQAHVPTPILGESVDDLIRLGGELWSQGTFGQALMALERALELDPDNAEAWYWKAITLDHLGNDAQAQAAFVQAARKYNQALALDPNDAWAWMGKGGLCCT